MKRFPTFSVTQVQQPLNEKDYIQVSGLKNSLSRQELSETSAFGVQYLDFLS